LINTWASMDVCESVTAPTESRSRRGSASSTMTVWPDTRRSREVERDEFGYEMDEDLDLPTQPETAHFRDGLINPDDFELVNLEQLLGRPVNGEGFETQRVVRPVAPLPSASPTSLSRR